MFSGTITRDIAEISGLFPRVLDGKVLYLSFLMRQWALEDPNSWPDLISTFRNAAELCFSNESWVRKDLEKVTSQYLPKKRSLDESPAPSPKRPRIDTHQVLDMWLVVGCFFLCFLAYHVQVQCWISRDQLFVNHSITFQSLFKYRPCCNEIFISRTTT